MQSRNVFFPFMFLLLYTSCAEETPAGDPPHADTDSVAVTATDSVQHDDSITVASSASRDTVASVLLEWEKYLQEKGINMSLDKFYAAGISEIHLDSGYAWDGVVEDYFVRSPDGHYYSHDVPSWDDGDADTYLYLYDVRKKRMHYLEVIGTCCTFMGNGWANDHTLIAVGYNTYDAEEAYPNQNLTQGFYSVYDLENGTQTLYMSRNYFRRPCIKCGPSSG